MSLAEARITSLAVSVVSLVDILAVGAVVEVEVRDVELMGAASVLVGEGAGFLSLADAEDSLIAEIVSMIDGVVSSTVALAKGTVVEAEVEVEEVLEALSLLADGVETDGAMTEVLVPLEVTPELTGMVVFEVASMALLTEDFDLVIVRKSEEENNVGCKT